MEKYQALFDRSVTAPDEVPQTEEKESASEQERAYVEAFKDKLWRSKLYEALSIKRHYKIPDQTLREKEVFEHLIDALAKKLVEPINIEKVKEMIGRFGLTEVEGREVAGQAIYLLFKDSRTVEVEQIKHLEKEFDLPKAVVAAAANRIAFEFLTATSGSDCLGLLVSGGFVTEEKMRSMAVEAVNISLANGQPDRAIELLDKYKIDRETVSQKEIIEAGEKLIRKKIGDSLHSVMSAKAKYNISDSFFQESDVKEKIEKWYLSELRQGHTESALEIKDKLFLDVEKIDSKALTEAKVRCLQDSIKRSSGLWDKGQRLNNNYDRKKFFDTIQAAQKELSLPDTAWQEEPIQETVETILHKMLYDRSPGVAITEIKEFFKIGQEFIDNTLLRSTMEEDNDGDKVLRPRDLGYNPLPGTIELMDSQNFDYALLQNNEDFLNALRRQISGIYMGSNRQAVELSALLRLFEEGVLTADSFRECQDSLEDFLGRVLIGIAEDAKNDKKLEQLAVWKEFKDKFNIPDSEELDKYINAALLRDLWRADFAMARRVQAEFNVPEPVFTEAATKVLNDMFNVYDFKEGASGARRFLKKFPLPFESYEKGIKTYLHNYQKEHSSPDHILEFQEMFKVPDEVIAEALSDKPLVRDYSLSESKMSQSALYENYDEKLASFRQKWLAAPEIAEMAIKKALINRLGDRIIEYKAYGDSTIKLEGPEAQGFIEHFKLTPADTQQAIFKELKNQLGNFSRIPAMLKGFQVTREMLYEDPKFFDNFYGALARSMDEESSRKTAMDIIKEYDLPSDVETILKHLPNVNKFADKIKRKFPEALPNFPASLEEIWSLISLQKQEDEFWNVVDAHPFLLKALDARFSQKLLYFFHRFDKPSVENISFLFENKEKIISENPEIDSDSVEFRREMQTRLLEYKFNREILEAIEKSGVKTDEWLNYSEERNFTFGQEEAKRFSEITEAPIKRIKETIGDYLVSVKNQIIPFKPELQASTLVLEDVESLRKEIELKQLQKTQAEAAGQTAKAEGILMGLRSLEARLETPRQTTAWNKLLGELEVVRRKAEKVFIIQEAIQAEEESLLLINADTELSAAEKRQRLLRSKEKSAALRQEFRIELDLLESRLKFFQDTLRGVIEPSLGADRSDALLQVVSFETNEQLDHYYSDHSTLKAIFNQDEEKNSPLEGRPATIKVWGRNPDRDLYLGNYTDCCIRIDSQHMGAESTISDYLTDLGIQVVEVIDEKSGEPVVALWLWIGDDENEKPALIIDNIEANTKYSNKFSQQLQAELKAYMNDYAKAIGLEGYKQGSSNNDLYIASEPMNGRYLKLGKSNRASGYYLEAEDNNGDNGVIDQIEFDDNDFLDYDDNET